MLKKCKLLIDGETYSANLTQQEIETIESDLKSEELNIELFDNSEDIYIG